MTDAITPDQVLRCLEDVDYPAGKEVLIAVAEQARTRAPAGVAEHMRESP